MKQNKKKAKKDLYEMVKKVVFLLKHHKKK
jgi:hypothetical protein